MNYDFQRKAKASLIILCESDFDLLFKDRPINWTTSFSAK
jgi:hypothetical protein